MELIFETTYAAQSPATEVPRRARYWIVRSKPAEEDLNGECIRPSAYMNRTTLSARFAAIICPPKTQGSRPFGKQALTVLSHILALTEVMRGVGFAFSSGSFFDEVLASQ